MMGTLDAECREIKALRLVAANCCSEFSEAKLKCSQFRRRFKPTTPMPSANEANTNCNSGPMMRSTGATTTLGDLQRATPWVWLNCEKCPHHALLACAVAVIRWGAGTSSDKLRPV